MSLITLNHWNLSSTVNDFSDYTLLYNIYNTLTHKISIVK